MFKQLSVILTIVIVIRCNGIPLDRLNKYTDDVNSWLSTVDRILQEFNRLSAELAWKMATEANETLFQKGIQLSAAKTSWQNTICYEALSLNLLSGQQRRMLYLLCRGPKYTKNQAKKMSQLMDKLSEAYTSAEVCVPENSWAVSSIQTKTINGKVCLKGEPDLEKILSRQDLSEKQLFWAWKAWHDTVGPPVKRYYPNLVKILNLAAKNNGYNDIGETWREELEIPNLEKVVRKLYQEVEPLYKMLHAVVRDKLLKKYGPNVIDPNGPIPAHLLGNMWAQDWSTLLHLLIPEGHELKLDENIGQKNWTVKDMVSLSEDMYVSLGLPKMTEKFWKYSKFEKADKNTSMCHGTAANMFDENDFRIILCAKLNMEDFYVIHHEMGHIEYYMAISQLPAVFQDSVSSALQESVGDSIMTGVMTPQHLHRLGLISDKQLLTEELDIYLLLQQALAKIPQLPYALLIDLYRWDIFKGKINPKFYNRAFWLMNKNLRGIIPPEPRNEEFFDAGAKFHVPDNTPYIRYFLSAILQMEMFKGMCELTIFGNITKNHENNIPFSLHRCDIYGSKKAGDGLKNMMAFGASIPWTQALEHLTGKNYISIKPLLEYYKPVYEWLKKYIFTNNISVGW